VYRDTYVAHTPQSVLPHSPLKSLIMSLEQARDASKAVLGARLRYLVSRRFVKPRSSTTVSAMRCPATGSSTVTNHETAGLYFAYHMC